MGSIFRILQTSIEHYLKMNMAFTLISMVLVSCTLSQSIIYPRPTPNLTGTHVTRGGTGDTCQHMQVTTNNVFRIGSNQILQGYSRANPLYNSILLNRSFNQATAFSISLTEARIAILQNASSLSVYPLSSFSLNFSGRVSLASYYPSHSIYYDTHVYLYYSQNSTSTTVRQWEEYQIYNGSWQSNSYFMQCSSATHLNTTGRHMVVSPNRNWTIYWDDYTNIQVYYTPFYYAYNPQYYSSANVNSFQCTSAQLIYTIASDILTPNITSSLSFSSNSSLLLIQFDTSAPIKIFNLLTGMVVWSYNYNRSIVAAQFLDAFSINLGIFQSDGIVIIQINTNKIVYNSSNLGISSNIFIDYSKSQIILCKANAIQTYSLQFACNSLISIGNANIYQYKNGDNETIYGFIPSLLTNANTLCLPCPSFCKVCYSLQSCVQCIENYINVGGSCFPLRVIGSIEGSIGGIVNNCIQITSIILSHTIAYLSLTPFLYFYLRVYSFVYVSSVYSYLRLPLPKYMQEIVNMSASSVKPSLPLSFSLNISEPIFNIFPQISVDIVKMCWMQAFSFILTLFLLLIVRTAYCLTQITKQTKTSLFYQIFVERWWQIATAHIVALMAGLTLTNSYLMYPLVSFLSRINFQMRVFGLGIAIIFPFFSISYIIKRNKINEKKNTARKKKHHQQQQVYIYESSKLQKIHHHKLMKIAELDKFHLYLINLAIPSLVLVPITLPFLIVNSILSFIYLPISLYARRLPKMRFLVGFIFFLYHHFYIVIYLYQNNDTLQAIGCSGACICLFLGILGEILLFLMEIVSNVKNACFLRIKDLFQKNRAVQDIERKKTQRIAKQTGLNFKISPEKQSTGNNDHISHTINQKYLNPNQRNAQKNQYQSIQPIASHIKIAKTVFRPGQLHFTISQKE